MNEITRDKKNLCYKNLFMSQHQIVNFKETLKKTGIIMRIRFKYIFSAYLFYRIVITLCIFNMRYVYSTLLMPAFPGYTMEFWEFLFKDCSLGTLERATMNITYIAILRIRGHSQRASGRGRWSTLNNVPKNFTGFWRI